LAAARRLFLEENQCPQRYIDLVDVKATSDDEVDADGTKQEGRLVHWIKRRPERSENTEAFICCPDSTREAASRQDPSKRWRKRLRLVPTDRVDSGFTSLPLNVPINYFSPDFFNQLQPQLCFKITNCQVALLPDPSQSFKGHTDEKLSDRKFMDKYRDEVHALYNLDNVDNWEDENWLADDEELMDIYDDEDQAVNDVMDIGS
jgi:hypothetical protein